VWPLTVPGTTNTRNQPLLLFHMNSTNTIVCGRRKSFIGSVVSCRVDHFWQNLDWKSVMDPSSQQNFWGHWQSQGHNKQEPAPFTLPYGSNKHHCMGKEEFHWICGVMGGWFLAKFGLKTSDGPFTVSKTSVTTDSPANRHSVCWGLENGLLALTTRVVDD
jgi:hypothetical protein